MAIFSFISAAPTHEPIPMSISGWCTSHRYRAGLKLSPWGLGWIAQQIYSVMANISELVRYQHGPLVVKTYELMDRMLSRRKKLVASLQNTFIVVDTSLIAINNRVQELIAQVICARRFRSRVCTRSGAVLSARLATWEEERAVYQHS